jgi:hypothetical protein
VTRAGQEEWAARPTLAVIGQRQTRRRQPAAIPRPNIPRGVQHSPRTVQPPPRSKITTMSPRCSRVRVLLVPSRCGVARTPLLSYVIFAELGINFSQVRKKTEVVLTIIYKGRGMQIDSEILADTDMAGPLAFCMALGGALLLVP